MSLDDNAKEKALIGLTEAYLRDLLPTARFLDKPGSAWQYRRNISLEKLNELAANDDIDLNLIQYKKIRTAIFKEIQKAISEEMSNNLRKQKSLLPDKSQQATSLEEATEKIYLSKKAQLLEEKEKAEAINILQKNLIKDPAGAQKISNSNPTDNESLQKKADNLSNLKTLLTELVVHIRREGKSKLLKDQSVKESIINAIIKKSYDPNLSSKSGREPMVQEIYSDFKNQLEEQQEIHHSKMDQSLTTNPTNEFKTKLHDAKETELQHSDKQESLTQPLNISIKPTDAQKEPSKESSIDPTEKTIGHTLSSTQEYKSKAEKLRHHPFEDSYEAVKDFYEKEYYAQNYASKENTSPPALENCINKESISEQEEWITMSFTDPEGASKFLVNMADKLNMDFDIMNPITNKAMIHINHGKIYYHAEEEPEGIGREISLIDLPEKLIPLFGSSEILTKEEQQIKL